MLLEMLVALAALLVSFYLYYTKSYDYWKKKGVVYEEPKFPFGTLHDTVFGLDSTGNIMNNYYIKYKKQMGLRFVGSFTFNQPSLTIFDLDLCKQILTKDFHNFVTRDFVPSTHEFISKHLFALEGQEWKDMRSKLTPTFTSGKMKNMFILMEKCAEQLQEHIDNRVLSVGEFEVKDLIARFTTDIIATCAFGLEVNSVKNKDDPFYKTGQLIFFPSRKHTLIFMAHKVFPVASRFFKLNFMDQRVSDVLFKIVKDTAEYRKQNNVQRNDFIDLLLKVKENKSLDDHETNPVEQKNGMKWCEKLSMSSPKPQHHDRLTLEEMTAQAFVFFAAGFETAASTTSFCLYELAKDQEVQDKLRQEIEDKLTEHGGLSYHALQDMKYMDQVVDETLRLYASLPLLTRISEEPYQIPGTDVVIGKGVRINIPTFAIHHDDEIYPEPYTFNPDRFSEENSKGRHPYAFIPFGEGPRICIGMRFGRLQVKVGLASLLCKYRISPTPDLPASLEIDPLIVFTSAKHPFKLRISRI